MAKFKDRNDAEWRVELDAPLIEEIREKHSIDLVNLESDPLLKLRNDPMTLVAVMYLICQEQIEAKEIDPKTFGRSMPSPPDAMLDAVREAIVDFFPSGRHSHIREVLAKYDEMNAKTDELLIAKMNKVLGDETTMKRLGDHADREIEEAFNLKFPLSSKAGTSSMQGLT